MAAGAGAGAANGLFSAISEIIDEAGDLLESIVNNLKEVVFIDQDIETTKIYPPTKRRGFRKIVKKTQHIKITAWDLVLLYAFGRVMGWWGPLVDWKDKVEDLKDAFSWKDLFYSEEWLGFLWENTGANLNSDATASLLASLRVDGDQAVADAVLGDVQTNPDKYDNPLN